MLTGDKTGWNVKRDFVVGWGQYIALLDAEFHI